MEEARPRLCTAELWAALGAIGGPCSLIPAAPPPLAASQNEGRRRGSVMGLSGRFYPTPQEYVESGDFPKTEADVFRMLQLPYRDPVLRNA